MSEKINILYAENEDYIRENVVEILKMMSVNVTTVTNGEDALTEYKRSHPDILITDIEMPKLNGLDLAKEIRKSDKHIQIILTSGYSKTEYFLKAIELNLVKYLLKPIHVVELKEALNNCFDNLKYNNNNIKYFNKTDYYNLKENRLIVNDEEKKLEYHEREFLRLMLKFPNSIVPYEQIETTVWDGYMSILALRTLVKNLRKKLPKNVITNVSKMGYKIELNV